MTEEKSVFQTFSEIDISSKIKEKNGMMYLPWNEAWAIAKSTYPSISYWITKTPEGQLYWTDGKTAYVETSVTVNNETITQALAIMDYKNSAIPIEKLTYTDVNKSIQRCLTKNLAMFGLGLSLWSGEEYSEPARRKKEQENAAAAEEQAKLQAIRKRVVEMCKIKVSEGAESEKLYDLLESIGGNRNPNKLSYESCEKTLEELENINK